MPDARRATVLESALETFARHGYRRTSMDAVAEAAAISRQGLYFLFDSKEQLFREAAAHVVAADLRAVEHLLADQGRPVADRIVDAFDRWAGRWIGPGARDVPAVVDANPALLDTATSAAPAAFEALLTTTLDGRVDRPVDVARTLVSVSIGLKHQVDTRTAYRSRLRAAVDLVVG